MGTNFAPKGVQSLQPIVFHPLCSKKPALPKWGSLALATCAGTSRGLGVPLVCRSNLFGSCHGCIGHGLKQACRASSNDFFDDELAKQIEELSQKFINVVDNVDEDDNGNDHDRDGTVYAVSEICNNPRWKEAENGMNMSSFSPLKFEFLEPNYLLGIRPGLLADWPERDKIMNIDIERKANSVDIPFSLRIIKRRKQQVGQAQAGFAEAGGAEFAFSCSVKKAFLSMVFMIQELQNYALQIRGSLCHEELQGIMGKVQREMNASFVWLFQQVFSRTPTLMVYVMILLANFTLQSLSDNTMIASTSSDRLSNNSIVETEVTSVEDNDQEQTNTRCIVIKKLLASCSGGVGNGGGGVGKVGQVKGGTEGGNKSSSMSIQVPNVVPDGTTEVSTHGNGDEVSTKEEVDLWNYMVEEASRMQQAESRFEVLDHGITQHFVSPVTAKIELDDYEEYHRTDLLYQMGISEEPNNPLLLLNYAQFLHFVAHDHDRAEECFKRAILMEPPDAEALSRYADFLWMVRKDLWGAEERYQEAIAAEPNNPYYASKYASFLWSTGGKETCFPLDTNNDN